MISYRAVFPLWLNKAKKETYIIASGRGPEGTNNRYQFFLIAWYKKNYRIFLKF